MSETRTLFDALVRNLMSFFFVGVAFMCAYNVFAVGNDVETLAKKTACQGVPLPCSAGITRIERTPWAHTLEVSTSPTSANRDLFCQRQYILVGDYACQFKDQIAEPIPSGLPSIFIKTVPPTNTNVRFPPKPQSSANSLPQAPSASPSSGP
jgi:hypothetical protein